MVLNKIKLISIITALTLVIGNVPIVPYALAVQESDSDVLSEEQPNQEQDNIEYIVLSESLDSITADEDSTDFSTDSKQTTPNIFSSTNDDENDDENIDESTTNEKPVSSSLLDIFSLTESPMLLSTLSDDEEQSDEVHEPITISGREYAYDEDCGMYFYRSSEDANDFWRLDGPNTIENTDDTSHPCEYFIETRCPIDDEWKKLEVCITLRPKDGAEQGAIKVDSDFIWGAYYYPWSECEDEAISVSMTIEGKIEAPSLYRFFAYLPQQIVIEGLGNFTNVEDIDGMFYGSAIENFDNIDIEKLDVSKVTSMSETFAECKSLTEVTLPAVSPKDVSGLFKGCKKLTKLDLDNLNTENVTTMYRMFAGCSSLDTIDLSKFDTSKVTNMTSMFMGCAALTMLDISKFNMLNVSSKGVAMMFSKDTTSNEKMNLQKVFLPNNFFKDKTKLQDLFNGCEELTDIWFAKPEGPQCQPNDVGSDLAGVRGMLSGCTNLSNETLENLFTAIDTTKITNLNNFFSKWKKEQIETALSKMNTQSVMSMNSMFKDCSFESIDLSKLNMKNVKDAQNMFKGCTQVIKIDLSKSEFASKYDAEIFSMFQNCTKLEEIIWPEGDYNINVSRMTNVFENCSSLIELDLSRFKAHNVNSQTPDFTNMFSGCRSLTSIKLGDEFYTETYAYANMTNMFSGCSSLENIDISGFKLSNVNNAEGMFEGCTNLKDIKFQEGTTTDVLAYANNMFKGCENLSEIDWDVFNNGSDHTMSTAGMFSGCSSLKEIGFTEGFKTSSMNGMFEGCTSLTDVNIKFNTKDCGDMSNAFAGCEKLEEITWGENFSTSKVENMSGMFSGCSSLTEIDVSSFDTKNVNDMSGMFSGCKNLEEITFCDEDSPNTFNTSKVTNMSGMFEDCSSLTELDVSSFDTKKVNDMSNMFARCSSLETLNLDGDNFVTTQAARENTTGMFDKLDSLNEVAFGDSFEGLQSQLPDKYWFDIHGNAYRPADIKPGEMEYFAKPKLRTTDELTKIVGASDFSLEISGVLRNEETKLTWTSSNTDVATVNSQGNISVKKPGITKIKVTHEYDLYADKDGTGVVDAETTLVVFDLKMDDTKIVAVGTQPFSLNTTFDFGDNEHTEDFSLTWTSSNTDIATIDSKTGKITVNDETTGTSQITASIDGVDNSTRTCNLIVGNITMAGNLPTVIAIGEEVEPISLDIQPNTISSSDIVWESSDPDMLSVDQTGKITPYKTGTVEIRASVEGIQDTHSITVADVTMVEKNKTVRTDSAPFTLDKIITPKSVASSVSTNWTSSNEDIATVDQNGKVTVHDSGIVDISVDIGGNKSICKLTVGHLLMDEPTKIIKKDTDSLIITANLTPVSLSDDVEWHSDNEDVVTIEPQSSLFLARVAGSISCPIKVHGTGTAVVTASVNGLEDSCEITVGHVNIKSESKTVSLSDKTFTIDTDITPSTLAKHIIWTSDNEEVATVDSNGIVTLKKPGYTTIKAIVNGTDEDNKIEDSIDLSVVDISFDQKRRLLKEDAEPLQLEVEISPSDLAHNVHWTSSDPDVASVDENGLVTVHSIGVTEITAEVNGIEETVKIIVGDLSFKKSDAFAKLGDEPFVLEVTLDEPDELNEHEIKWESSNASVAMINEDTGKITPISPGTTNIKVTIDGIEAECTLTILSVIFEQNNIEVNIDDEPFTVGFTITPGEFADSNIKWSSSAPEIVSVDEQTGEVTIHKAGSANIIADVEGVEFSYAVKVVDPNANIDDDPQPNAPGSDDNNDSSNGGTNNSNVGDNGGFKDENENGYGYSNDELKSELVETGELLAAGFLLTQIISILLAGFVAIVMLFIVFILRYRERH